MNQIIRNEPKTKRLWRYMSYERFVDMLTMIKTLLRKKNHILILLSIVLTLGVSIQSAFAYTKGNCTFLTVCKKSTFASTDNFVESDLVLMSKGDAFEFGFYNNGSTHNLAYGIYRWPDYSLIYGPKGVTAGGIGNWNNYGQAPSDGYYYIRAQCGGSGQTGCDGYAWIAK
ncbi:hypothetical protein Elgi_67410 [Paenibacillus elgii]|uniref:hypothetical protein n=1 Tax=Paenibacillus elgii TaxID=189691 RepID=UPI002D7A8432|nr:hypothetical protein Elgi_67410 [Paenibacillus elgii]